MINNNDNKWIKITAIVCIGIVPYLSFFLLDPMKNVHGHNNVLHYALSLLFFTSVAAIIWIINSVIIRKADKIFKWETNPVKKLAFLISVNTIFTFSIVILFVALYAFIVIKTIDGIVIKAYMPVFMDDLVIFILVLLFYQAIYTGVYLFRQWEKSIRESENLKQEILHSQLHALQNQTSPHFLFNSLNVLVSLIEERPPVAIEFVKRLSIVYRYLLQKSEQHLVLLKDEVSFINSYLFLQNQRFGDNLKSVIDIPSYALDFYIAPLTLQILFENAIKHNIISSSKPLTIKLYLDHENNLVVENNLQYKLSSGLSTGLGLKNIENRYRILARKDIRIMSDGFGFKVTIPLLSSRSIYENSNN